VSRILGLEMYGRRLVLRVISRLGGSTPCVSGKLRLALAWEGGVVPKKFTTTQFGGLKKGRQKIKAPGQIKKKE